MLAGARNQIYSYMFPRQTFWDFLSVVQMVVLKHQRKLVLASFLRVKRWDNSSILTKTVIAYLFRRSLLFYKQRCLFANVNIKSQICSIRNQFLFYGWLQFKAYTKIHFYSGNYRDMVIASGNIALSRNIECLQSIVLWSAYTALIITNYGHIIRLGIFKE